MPLRANAEVISLSVLLRGFISVEFRAVNFAEEFVAELPLCHAQEDFAIAGSGVRLAHRRLGETPDGFGEVEGSLKAFGGG